MDNYLEVYNSDLVVALRAASHDRLKVSVLADSTG